MPLYEYHCPTCSHKFEKLQSMSAAGADCPNCEQPAKRAISVFARVGRAGEGEPSFGPGPLPPLGGGGCCGGGCGCGH
jgi:putative FmdB family regulatory protein